MQSAQTKAKTLLVHKFPDKYRELFLEEKEKATGKNYCVLASNRARRRLVSLYYNEYRTLYKEARDQGFPTRK
jgi:hypothetical protein